MSGVSWVRPGFFLLDVRIGGLSFTAASSERNGLGVSGFRVWGFRV